MIANVDEDSDEDGNKIENPVGISNKFKPYEAPSLNLKDDGPDTDEELIETLKRTPRSKLTPSQK